MARTSKNFEESVRRLEEIVKSLESGDTGLDDSLKLYEEGVALVRFCHQKLDSAEQKIRILGDTETETATE